MNLQKEKKVVKKRKTIKLINYHFPKNWEEDHYFKLEDKDTIYTVDLPVPFIVHSSNISTALATKALKRITKDKMEIPKKQLYVPTGTKVRVKGK